MLAKEDAIDLKKEQCGVVRLLFLLKKMLTEYHPPMCEAYRDPVMSRRQVFYRWQRVIQACQTVFGVVPPDQVDVTIQSKWV